MAFQSSPEHQPENSVNPLEQERDKTKNETTENLRKLQTLLTETPNKIESTIDPEENEQTNADQFLANIDTPEAFAERTPDTQNVSTFIKGVVMNSKALATYNQDRKTAEEFLKEFNDNRGLGVKYSPYNLPS